MGGGRGEFPLLGGGRGGFPRQTIVCLGGARGGQQHLGKLIPELFDLLKFLFGKTKISSLSIECDHIVKVSGDNLKISRRSKSRDEILYNLDGFFYPGSCSYQAEFFECKYHE